MPAKKRKSRNRPTKQFALVFLALTIVTISLTNLLLSLRPTKTVVITRYESLAQSFWQDIIMKYPTYRDGYLELVKIALDTNDTEMAQALLNQAETLDPFSSSVNDLRKVLGAMSQ